MTKTLKRLVIIISILLIVNVIIWTNTFIIVFRYNYKPIDCLAIQYIPKQPPNEITVEKAVELVNEHFNINYTLKFENLRQNGMSGNATLILNIVRLDKNLNGWEVLATLTHELCHIKYYTINETFTEYMSFVELYESDNDILKNRANWLIYEHCTLQIYKHTKYDCGWYILEYLKN